MVVAAHKNLQKYLKNYKKKTQKKKKLPESCASIFMEITQRIMFKIKWKLNNRRN